MLDPKADIRTRCIRAYLMELVSLCYSCSAYKVVPEGPAQAVAKTTSRARFRAAKARAVELFQPDDTNLADDPGKWAIEGHRHEGWTEITKERAEMHELGLDGGALYELLAVGAHPQGFSATAGLKFDADGQGTRVFTVELVEKQVRLAIVSFYSALTLVASYHGQRQPLLVDWENEILRVLPGVLSAPEAAGQPA